MAPQDFILDYQELIENPTARVPICLVLDTSGSMGMTHRGDKSSAIEALNEGVAAFYRSVFDDEMARYAADVAIVSFSSQATTIEDFGSVERPVPHVAVTGGATSLGTGVRLGLDLLDARKKQYQLAGVDYFQPWLVLMTDGQPTDMTHVAVAAEVADLVGRRKLTVFPIGIGSEADLAVLELLNPQRTPLRLQGLNFSAFFEWLSRSVVATSRSMPGEDVKLDFEGVKGWASL